MKPIYRADHVGSMLRPIYLLEAREKCAAGEISAKALEGIEDQAIREVLAMQREVGMPILSDGELRRESWSSGPAAAIEGFVESDATVVWTGTDGRKVEELAKSVCAVAKLRPRRRITGVESEFLRREAGGPYKITMPSPALAAFMFFQPGKAPGVYDTADELMQDLIEIQKAEFAALVADGAAYLQIDEGFTPYVGNDWRLQMQTAGIDPDKALSRVIDAENQLYASIPRDRTTLAIHICRGNSRSRYVFTGGYDAMAEQVFSRLQVDRFLLEYDSERSGGFAPLRHLGKGKVAVLGLITTKSGALETEDLLLRRIEEAARYVPIEQLALSPQCGFASVKEGNDIAFDEQRRKLELTVKVAEKVWGRLV
jgi:5-methyltetrahydropteroyltriglutamate--homocysteine methyltransferase